MFSLIIAAFFLGFLLDDFFSLFSYFGVELHQSCLRQAPKNEHKFFYQALVCGKNLPVNGDVFRLKKLGLIHLMVVSGAHLMFLVQMLKTILPTKTFYYLRLPLSFLFVMNCQFKTPLLRAWLHYAISDFNSLLRLFIPSSTVLLLSVLICLSHQPEQFKSVSLLLSWLASLGIQKGKNPFTQSFLIYIFTFPILLSIYPLSIWSILINTFLAPPIGWILFPVSLLSFFFKFLIPLTNQLWSLLFYLLEWVSIAFPKTLLEPYKLPELLYWMYALVLQLTLHRIGAKK